MPKKSRRARNAPRLSSAQLSGTAPTTALPNSQAGRLSASRAYGATVRQEDYSHVVSDLKRIAVLAGSILVVMIVLAFVLPYVIR